MPFQTWSVFNAKEWELDGLTGDFPMFKGVIFLKGSSYTLALWVMIYMFSCFLAYVYFVNKWCDVLKELVRTQLLVVELILGFARPLKKDDEVWELHAKNNPGKILSVSQHEPLINYISKWWLISVRLHPHLKRMILNSRHTISVVELLPRKKGVFIWLRMSQQVHSPTASSLAATSWDASTLIRFLLNTVQHVPSRRGNSAYAGRLHAENTSLLQVLQLSLSPWKWILRQASPLLALPSFP